MWCSIILDESIDDTAFIVTHGRMLKLRSMRNLHSRFPLQVTGQDMAFHCQPGFELLDLLLRELKRLSAGRPCRSLQARQRECVSGLLFAQCPFGSRSSCFETRCSLAKLSNLSLQSRCFLI